MYNMDTDNNIVNNDEKQETIQKKVIALAFQGEKFSSKFLLCWTNTLTVLWQTGKYEFLVACGDNPSIYHSRLRTLGLNNEIHKPFNGNKFDCWITIDYNMLFTPQQLIELIESLDEHPVVSGLYKSEDAVSFFAVKTLDNDYYSKNGSYKFVTQEDLDNWKKETESKYMDIEFTGLSFFGVKYEVIEKLKYPYFNGDILSIKKQDDSEYKIITGEDYNFCKNVREAGYTIMLNTDLRLGNSVNIVI
jgi:hypothetical protein